MASYSYRLPRKYRYRPRGKNTTRDRAIGLAVGAALIAAGGKTAAAHHVIPAVTTRAVVPSGSAYTPQSWAAALLAAGGWPQTACNLGAIEGWERAEGGNWENSAAYNPLDTTQYEPGSSTMNSDGVRAYTSWPEGFQATLTTLDYADYTGIRSALSAGTSAQAVADAVGASPWGTGDFEASC